MPPPAAQAAATHAAGEVPGRIILLLAAACGIIVANLYYAQPLVGPISQSTGLSPAAAGLIVTLTQIGYGLGLLFIVPLGDLVENRRLVVIALAVTALALLGAALSSRAEPFLLSAFVLGLGAVAAQILVPYAAHLAPEAIRGRVVGSVMSGLLLGIMLARPFASFVADLAGWHTVYVISAAATGLLALVLSRVLPPRRPEPGAGYGALIASMGRLVLGFPILRRRALYHACLFAAFSLFWTTVPLLLAGPGFGLTQRGIAVFALVGVSGAIAAPLAGRIADRGWSRPMTAIAVSLVAIALAMTRLGETGGAAGLLIVTAAAVILDFGVSANLVLGQRAIFALGAEYRSRLNGLYMATFFAGGAFGSAVGVWAYARGGWPLASAIGVALPLLALAYFATELTGRGAGRAAPPPAR